MTPDTSPQLCHFTYDKWLDEDGDGFNMVIMDPGREAIEAAFADLMNEESVDADGRYSEEAMEAAWIVATKGRPQMSRWLFQRTRATSRGDTCPVHREPLARHLKHSAALPHRLGVMWSSPASENAVREVLAAQPNAWPSFIVTGKYHLSERPERFVTDVACDLKVNAWTLHCSGMEGPITLLARLDDIVFVLPAEDGDDAGAVLAALPQTMRWVLWTAHQLGFPYTVVGLGGNFIPSPASLMASTATAAEVEAARAARRAFTQELSTLDFEFRPGGSGLFLRDRSLPLDLLDVPFPYMQRLSRWHEWGEELFAVVVKFFRTPR